MGLAQEFKEFTMRGNVVDLAVGVIIGGAFGQIINSMVNDILMPPIGLLMGGVNFNELKFRLQEASMDAAGKVIPEVSVNYGAFLNTIISFLIIAICIFMVIKAMNSMKKKEVPVPVPPPAGPTKEEQLLTEIRDALRAKNG